MAESARDRVSPRLVKLRQRRNSSVELESLVLVGSKVSEPDSSSYAVQFGAPLPLVALVLRGSRASGERPHFSPTNQASAPGWHLRTMSNPVQSFDSHRRSAVFGRQPEELHIPSTGLINPNLASTRALRPKFPRSTSTPALPTCSMRPVGVLVVTTALPCLVR